MDSRTMIIVAVVAGALIVGVIVAVAIAIWFYSKNKTTKELRSKFGPEYNRAVRADDGNIGHAEDLLQERQKRVAKLNIKPLTEEQRTEFADAWEHAQARFVDDPAAAVTNADVLVQEVMNVRGYPVTDFDQRVADVSVDHPAVVRGVNYLKATQQGDGLWSQPHYTGGGFPRVFYLNYHGYPKFFPLWALARYRNLKSGNSRRVEFGL